MEVLLNNSPIKHARFGAAYPISKLCGMGLDPTQILLKSDKTLHSTLRRVYTRLASILHKYKFLKKKKNSCTNIQMSSYESCLNIFLYIYFLYSSHITIHVQ